jgi:hypothetical protein
MVYDSVAASAFLLSDGGEAAPTTVQPSMTPARKTVQHRIRINMRSELFRIDMA